MSLTSDLQTALTTLMGTTQASVAAAATAWANALGAITSWGGAGEPPGSIKMFGGAAAPTGYLLCDGSAVSQATYAALYAIIGTTFGAPGGGNFNLPDFRGVFPKGSGTTGRAAGVDASGNAYAATLGAYLQDKMQGHYQAPLYNGATEVQNTAGSGSGYVGASFPSHGAGTALSAGSPSTDSVNGTPRTGHTTEPQSLGISFIIKT